MGWDAFDANGTRITQGRYDFLGKLVSPAIAVTGATTATINRMHYVTGTSADYTITMPSAAVAGNHLAFMFGPTVSELSKLVTVNGRPYWFGESLVLESDGAAWLTIGYDFKAMICVMSKTSQSLSTATETKLTIDTTLVDNTGLMANTGSNKMTCRRTGSYGISFLGTWNPTLVGVLFQGYAKVNGSSIGPAQRFNSATGQFFSTEITRMGNPVTAAQDIEAWAGQYTVGSETISEIRLAVVETMG